MMHMAQFSGGERIILDMRLRGDMKKRKEEEESGDGSQGRD